MNKTVSLVPLLLAGLLATTSGLANAQGLRPLAAQLPASNVTRAADHIVAVVNADPITNQEVLARLERLGPPAGGNLPPREELAKQVLERLIQEKTQLQWATESGIKVDETAVNEAEQNVARQNRLTVPQLHERLKTVGLTQTAFRANLRNELLLQRVREREVDNRVKVTEQDIDTYLDEQRRPGDPAQVALNLGHILVQVPENASLGALASLQAKADSIAQRARAGENFAALARELSDAPEGRSGGQLGLRNADRYPSLFVQATLALKNGDVAGPVRSGAGFHILKVLEKRNLNLPASQQVQTRARHILLRPSAQLSQDAAMARLNAMRQDLRTGKANFEELARQFSQDGSAGTGGDLGWASPGQFVPEFEQVMNELQPNQVSEPLVSRFGVHLIQVLERRQVDMSPREQREAIRNLLRERKAEEAYENWARDLRARAYVEYREPQQ
jgi:peptidyl-prolyl cis-trans isomerase SurA